MLIPTRRQKCRLINQISQVRARKARRPPRQNVQVRVFGNRLAFGVNFQNRNAPDNVRLVDDNLPVKASRSQKSLIQNIGAVRRGDYDNALVGREPVHFNKQLIQSLLALIMTAADICAALTPYRVYLIYKDYARGILLRLREQVTNPRRAHAYFNKI